MKRIVAATIVALLAVVASLADASPAKSYLPFAKGASWTYDVSGATEKRIEMRVTGRQGDRWVISWGRTSGALAAFAPLEATVTAAGGVLYTRRAVGAAAQLEMVPLADLRWGGPETWQAQTRSGCMGMNLDGSRGAPESVTVPAGTFTCQKICNRSNGEDDTWWVAQGVGLVKRVYGPAGHPVEWRLVRSSAGQH